MKIRKPMKIKSCKNCIFGKQLDICGIQCRKTGRWVCVELDSVCDDWKELKKEKNIPITKKGQVQFFL